MVKTKDIALLTFHGRASIYYQAVDLRHAKPFRNKSRNGVKMSLNASTIFLINIYEFIL